MPAPTTPLRYPPPLDSDDLDKTVARLEEGWSEGVTLVAGGRAAPRRLCARGSQGLFEREVAVVLGDRIIQSDDDAAAFWSAITNVIWRDDDGNAVLYSFRSAGDLIASIRGGGSYLDWYCCSSPGSVAPWICEPLARFGWRPEWPAEKAARICPVFRTITGRAG